jgi:hypothetical protein
MRKRWIPQAQQVCREPWQPPIFNRWFLRSNIAAAASLLIGERRQFLATVTVIMIYTRLASMTGTRFPATD